MMTAELHNVTKRYGQAEALHEISLALRPGELVALLGPNGAGKTTAVKLLLGLIRPTSGTVRVFGQDPQSQAARVQIGAMLQVARVPDTLQVREHVELFRSYYPAPLPFSEVIARAGLKGLESRRFGELSGGQKQRVLFALALCGNPKLLFLDEPTVGMDLDARRLLWEQARLFAQQGGSVLLTTHYLEEADALAQRVIVVQKGRVIANDTTANVKSQVAGSVVRCATSLSAADLELLPGVKRITRLPARVEILTSAPDQLVRELLRRDATACGLEVLAAGLGEVFDSLMQDKMEVSA